jgi:WD40 repeat protein
MLNESAMSCLFKSIVAILLISGLAGHRGDAQALASSRLKGYVSAAAMSPDGRSIAIDVLSSVQNADGSWENVESIQVLDSKTSRAVSTTPLSNASLVKDAPLGSGGAFVGYCDNAKALVAYDQNGLLYVMDASSHEMKSKIDLGLGELHSRRSDAGAIQVIIACSTSSSTLAVAVHGGRFGAGLIKSFDLTNGELLAELNQESSGEIFAISVSPNGSKLAILLRNQQSPLKPINGPNVTIYDLRDLRVRVRFSTGDVARDLVFCGDSEVATVQGLAGRFAGRRAIQLWNVESGKEEKRLFDAHLDIQSPISASSNGELILGYIPKIRECALCNGLEGSVEVKEQRFAVWNTHTGQQIFRSDSFGPIIRSTTPECILGQNGEIAIVYWPANDITPKLLSTR